MWKKSRKCGALSDFIITAVMGHSWHKILYEHTKCFNYRFYWSCAAEKGQKRSPTNVEARCQIIFGVNIFIKFSDIQTQKGPTDKVISKGKAISRQVISICFHRCGDTYFNTILDWMKWQREDYTWIRLVLCKTEQTAIHLLHCD